MVVARVVETVAIDDVAPPGSGVGIATLLSNSSIWFPELSAWLGGKSEGGGRGKLERGEGGGQA